MQTKTCTKCQLSKELSYFHKDANGKYGVKSTCKNCQKLYDQEHGKLYRSINADRIKSAKREYYENNKEKIKKNTIEYRRKNKDVIAQRRKETGHYKKEYAKYKEKRLENSKRWNENNKEHVKKRAAKYHQDHKDHYRELHKKWISNNREKSREYVRKRRAKKLSLNENYSKEDELYTRSLFENKCANCGSTNRLCLDHHKPLILGNPLTRQNAVLLCTSCNCRKSNSLPEDFYDPETLNRIESILFGLHTPVPIG